jgi:ATPase subunit of ABC transporter with duplicated ATPase domains
VPPTDHLDDDGLRRLTAILTARRGAVVMASHDRALLADTISDSVELDRRTARATHYRGGWTAYVREREAPRGRARARVHDNEKQSREWVTMRAEEMTGRARKIGGRGRRIEAPDAPWEPPALRFHLTAAQTHDMGGHARGRRRAARGLVAGAAGLRRRLW